MQDTEFTRALKALAEDEKRLEEERAADQIAEEQSTATALFMKVFGIAPDRVVGPIIKKDGVTLEMVKDGRFRALAVVGLCPICGKEALSAGYTSANQLASLIVDFVPGWQHNATHPIDRDSMPSSPERRLVDALRDLVMEFAQGG